MEYYAAIDGTDDEVVAVGKNVRHTRRMAKDAIEIRGLEGEVDVDDLIFYPTTREVYRMFQRRGSEFQWDFDSQGDETMVVLV